MDLAYEFWQVFELICIKEISWRGRLRFYSLLKYLNVDKKFKSIILSIQFGYSKNNQKLKHFEIKYQLM